MIIQRYLLREVGVSVAAVLAVLLVVYSSNRFVQFLTEAALGRTSTELLFQMLALKLTGNLSVLAPIALFLGAIFALGRLHRDSEVVAMTAGGLSTRTLVNAMFWFSLAAAVVTSVLSLYVSPTVYKQYDVVRTRAKEGYHVTGILPGRFKSFDDGEKVVYAAGVSEDKRSLEGVFVQVRPRDGGPQQLIVSGRAYQSLLGREQDRFIVLEDGHRYSGTPGSADFVVTRFAKHAVRLEQARPTELAGNLDSTSTIALWTEGSARSIAELQWRLSLPMSVIVLGLMAVPISRSDPRQGRYARLFVAVLVYFLYNNAIGVAQKLVERGDLNTVVGVWPVHLAVGALALGLVGFQSTGSWRIVAYLRQRKLAS